MLPDVVGYLAGLLAVGVAGHRLVAERGATGNPVLRYVCVLGICLGLSVLIQAPASLALFDRIRPAVHLADWAGDQLTMIALSMVALVAGTVRGPVRSPRRYLVLAGAVLAAMTALFLLAHPVETSQTFAVRGAGRWWMVGYKSLFLGYGTWCLLVFVRQFGRYAGRVDDQGVVRVGLLLFVAAGVVGLLWTGWTVSDIQSIVGTGVIDAAEDPVTAVLGAVCLSLAAAGITVASWGRGLRAWRRWWRAYRGYRRIRPLWTALHRAFPRIALAGAGGPVPRDAEFALYRRVIEIHDGHLALRAYCHPEAAGWAAEADDATVRAAVIAAALEAAAAGHRYPTGPGEHLAPHGLRADVDAETDWLGRVADAFTGSGVVDRIRRRVRAELAA